MKAVKLSLADLLSAHDEEDCTNPMCPVHGKEQKHPVDPVAQVMSLREALAALDEPTKFKRGDLIRAKKSVNNYTIRAESPHMFLEYLAEPLDYAREQAKEGEPERCYDFKMMACLPDGTVLRYYGDSRDWELHPDAERLTINHS